MKFLIGSNIRVLNPTKNLIKYCKEVLTIDNPDYLNAKKLGIFTWGVDKKLKLFVLNGDELILPFGCLKDIWKLEKNIEYELFFPKFKGNNMLGDINLYNYQSKALKELVKGKNGILIAPCGSGKTQIGLKLIKDIRGRALWLTHTRKLLEQSKKRCESYFKGDFGIITNGEVKIGKDVTFATVQTMSKLDKKIYENEFDIIIVDECHHCVGTPTKVMQFYKILSNCNCRYKYGLTATLLRADNLINTVFSIIGGVIYEIKKEAVGNKIIKAKYIPINVNINYNKENYLEVDGTFVYSKLIDTLSFSEERNKIIINKVFEEFNKGKKQIILCHRVKQVEILSTEISKFCKVNCLSGKIKNKKRNYDGDVIIATYQLAKEGLDIPTLNVLHLATPQKNESTTKQSLGRIERNIKGKEIPICYDYIDINISYCVSCFRKRKRIIKKS